MNVVEIITGTLRSLVCDALNRLITAASAPLEQRTVVGELAASVSIVTAALDLGPAETRQHTRILASKFGLASAGEQLTLQWSDDAVGWYAVIPGALGSASTFIASNGTSAPHMHVQGIPPGRYVRISYTNGATPQTALTLSITAIAGI